MRVLCECTLLREMNPLIMSLAVTTGAVLAAEIVLGLLGLAPTWLLLIPFLWPSVVFYLHTQRLRLDRSPTPSYYPFFLAAVFFMAALAVWGLHRIFWFVREWAIHQAVMLMLIGTAVYAAQMARNVWLDFRKSRDVVAGYISLVLFTGGTMWWLHVCLQFFIATVFQMPGVRAALGIVALGVYCLFAVGKMPPPLHTYHPATKMRMFVPKIVAAYVVTLASFSLLYSGTSSAPIRTFCWTKQDAQGASTPTPLTFADSVYLSVITQTTTGYGDLTPCGSGIRFLAAIQAIFGTMIPLVGFGYLLTSIGEQKPEP